jgi:competence protein ComEC
MQAKWKTTCLSHPPFTLSKKCPLYTDVLKVGKHGSDTASSYDFIAAVSPQIGVISYGADNGYGHPYGDMIMNLQDCRVKEILTTAEEGNIHLRIEDGKLLRVIGQ